MFMWQNIIELTKSQIQISFSHTKVRLLAHIHLL